MVGVPKPTRKRRTKTKRKESYKALVKKADTAFSKYVRNLYRNTCVTCGTTQRPTCSHLITRTKRSVRWDIDNCATQCSSCNFKHEFFPEAFTAWWINKHGVQKYNELIQKSNQVKKHTREELQQIIEAYSL